MQRDGQRSGLISDAGDLLVPFPRWATWQGILSRVGVGVAIIAMLLSLPAWVELAPPTTAMLGRLKGALPQPPLLLVLGLTSVILAERGARDATRPSGAAFLTSVTAVGLLLASVVVLGPLWNRPDIWRSAAPVAAAFSAFMALLDVRLAFSRTVSAISGFSLGAAILMIAGQSLSSGLF